VNSRQKTPFLFTDHCSLITVSRLVLLKGKKERRRRRRPAKRGDDFRRLIPKRPTRHVDQARKARALRP